MSSIPLSPYDISFSVCKRSLYWRCKGSSSYRLASTLTTLDHTIHKPLSNELEPLRKGELRMIQIERT